MNPRTATRRLIGSALLLAYACAGLPARAADPHALLRRSVTVDRTVSYRGTKVLTKWVGGEESASTVKTYHLAPGKTLTKGVDGSLAGVLLLQVNHEHFVSLGD